jgi:hypothetical protein
MRQLMTVLAFASLALAVFGQDFTQTMTPEERRAAGLDRLSAEELARLKAAVERYKSGEVTAISREAEQKVAAVKHEAAERVAAAEAKAKETVAARPADRSSGPSWLKALVTLKKAEEQPDAQEALESRIAGSFKGWRRGTMFDLENGQRWQHVDGEDYVTPPAPSPRVTIKPGAFGTFWMQIEGVKPRVRVKPVRLD